MLCVNAYKEDYINESWSWMESQITAYKLLLTTVGMGTGNDSSALCSAVASFEPMFLNSLIVVLDGFFVHRSRMREGKDGNPLNEVRMLCKSILENRAVLSADKTIKYNPTQSISGIRIGEVIKLTVSDFEQIFRAFFTEIETKFM